jgi:competence protein ComEA
MNPFIESTVARPLPESGAAASAAWRRRGLLRPRRAVARALGLAAALGLAGHVLVAVAAPAVNVNSATEAQLRSVRGIGPKTARLIVDERTRGGKYDSLEDLATRVKGIGPKKAATLRAGGLVAQDGDGPAQ